ncbi:hypothetical protein JW964_14580 [candidate division KSB1 bacterium]|nr:hypothetical protein [candidate division KSB1 bacterium]
MKKSRKARIRNHPVSEACQSDDCASLHLLNGIGKYSPASCDEQMVVAVGTLSSFNDGQRPEVRDKRAGLRGGLSISTMVIVTIGIKLIMITLCAEFVSENHNADVYLSTNISGLSEMPGK